MLLSLFFINKVCKWINKFHSILFGCKLLKKISGDSFVINQFFQLSLCKIHYWSTSKCNHINVSTTKQSFPMRTSFLFIAYRKWLRKHGATICGGTIQSSSTHSTGCLSQRWCVPNATRSLWPSTPSATWVCPYLLVRRGSWRCSMYRWIPQPNPPRFVLCHILKKKKKRKIPNCSVTFGRKNSMCAAWQTWSLWVSPCYEFGRCEWCSTAGL